eukprot:Lithocolla_globosa_v1_NODE_3319_length_1701_cov_160.367558.p2 type:complete len:100 gc:universal NODE_3319_length_1701_cov_160.367558:399-698(+)
MLRTSPLKLNKLANHDRLPSSSAGPKPFSIILLTWSAGPSVDFFFNFLPSFLSSMMPLFFRCWNSALKLSSLLRGPAGSSQVSSSMLSKKCSLRSYNNW